MNFQNSRSHSGKLTIELASYRKSFRNNCVLVKHVGKTKPTDPKFTCKTKQARSRRSTQKEIRALSKMQEEHFCTPAPFIVLIKGIPHDLKILMGCKANYPGLSVIGKLQNIKT